MVVAYRLTDTASDPVVDLTLRARESDGLAFAELVERYERTVYNYVLRLVRNPEDAQDVSQEVWIRVAKSLPELRDPSRFTPWLYRIARNCCLNFLNARKSRATVSTTTEEDETFDLPDVDAAGPEAQIVSLDERRKVWESLGTLSERDRTALFLREVEELSYADIANTLSISRNAAEVRVFRARERFRKLFHKVEADASTCEVSPLQLSALVDGELPDTSRANLEYHLAQCGDCASRLRSMRTGQKLYRGIGLVAAPEAIRAFVLAQLGSLFGGGAAATAGGVIAGGGVAAGLSAVAGGGGGATAAGILGGAAAKLAVVMTAVATVAAPAAMEIAPSVSSTGHVVEMARLHGAAQTQPAQPVAVAVPNLQPIANPFASPPALSATTEPPAAPPAPAISPPVAPAAAERAPAIAHAPAPAAVLAVPPAPAPAQPPVAPAVSAPRHDEGQGDDKPGATPTKNGATARSIASAAVNAIAGTDADDDDNDDGERGQRSSKAGKHGESRPAASAIQSAAVSKAGQAPIVTAQPASGGTVALTTTGTGGQTYTVNVVANAISGLLSQISALH